MSCSPSESHTDLLIDFGHQAFDNKRGVNRHEAAWQKDYRNAIMVWQLSRHEALASADYQQSLRDNRLREQAFQEAV